MPPDSRETGCSMQKLAKKISNFSQMFTTKSVNKTLFFILFATVASLVSLPSHGQIVSGFQGPYVPASWTFSTPGPGGSVNTAAVPASISLTGTSGSYYNLNTKTDYTTTALDTGLVKFNWNYSSIDYGNYDQFYYLLNNTATFLADNNQQGSGTTVFSVVAGDTFGWRVFSVDSFPGPGVAVISNFSAPVPGPLPVLGAAAAYSFSRRLRHKTRLGTQAQA